MHMKVIIVEDETAAARNLIAILAEVAPDAEVAVILESVADTVRWFKEQAPPDLVFMDIHLADGSAFHIFEQVEVLVPVVFITAYDDYAIEAFKVNSIDYLLKPVNPELLRRSLNKLLRRESHYLYKVLSDLAHANPETQKIRNLLVISGNRIIPLALNRIAFFYTRNEKVSVYTLDGQCYTVDKTLDALILLLPAEHFFRVNRQYIVASASVGEVEFWLGSRLKVNPGIEPPEDMIVSKSKVPSFKDWLQNCS